MIKLLIMCYAIFSSCDNIEIRTSEFDEIQLFNNVINSRDHLNINSLKISHLGTSIYRLEKIGNKRWKLIDISVYISEKPARLKIDFEHKIFGIASYVYWFILYNIIIVLISYKAILYCFDNFEIFKRYDL